MLWLLGSDSHIHKDNWEKILKHQGLRAYFVQCIMNISTGLEGFFDIQNLNLFSDNFSNQSCSLKNHYFIWYKTLQSGLCKEYAYTIKYEYFVYKFYKIKLSVFLQVCTPTFYLRKCKCKSRGSKRVSIEVIFKEGEV